MRIPCVKEGGSEMKKDYSIDEMKKIMGKGEAFIWKKDLKHLWMRE
jgi:hypothetical protein